MAKTLEINQEQDDPVIQQKKRTIYHIGKFSHVIGAKWIEAEIRAMADELYDWLIEDESRFWLKGYFIEKGIPYRQVERLRSQSDYFDEVFSMCRDIQEQRLFEYGCKGKIRTPMSIFGLKNMGWTDTPKEDIDDHQLIIDWGNPEEWERLSQEQQAANNSESTEEQ